MLDKPCPFCEIAADQNHSRIITQNQHAFVICDGFPVSDGHTLIIPKQHIGSYFDLSADQKQAMLELLELSKIELDKTLKPHGYNIGINDGSAAGQTVPHCHMHLIPRYNEPDKDPRGGVRWVVPEKADYWSGRS
jgi:diadenosine tetraphosphate (Ap4A) HIT family hydrolase